MFPYLLLIGLTACSMGILHSFKSFFSSAIGPCLLNVSLIASSILAANFLKEPIYGLAIGVIVGGILQLTIQLPYLYRVGFRLKRVRDFMHPAIRLMRNLLIPRIFGSAVYQLNIFVDTLCASLSFIVGSGAVAAIYYANRIIQFPLAVFGIALAQAILPMMSQAASGDAKEFRKTVVFALESICLIMIPATLALAILAQPIIKILFQRGSFGEYATAITSSALLFYSFGLFAFAGIKIMVSAFHALKDTKTPVKIAAICLVINALLNFILMWKFKVAGIALASSISSITQFLLLLYIFKDKIGNVVNKDFIVYILRVVFISGIMATVLYFSWNNLFFGVNEILRLVIVIILGLVSFCMACLLFGSKEKEILLSWISGKK